MATGIFALVARLFGISPDVAKVIAILIAIAAALGSPRLPRRRKKRPKAVAAATRRRSEPSAK